MSTVDSGAAVGIAEQVAAQLAKGRNPDLAKAYVAFCSQVANVVKDAQNPHLKNNYATLEATLRVVKPALAANKLALLSVPGVVRDGNMTITTMLVHESGQAWTFTTELPLGEKTDKKTGKAIPATAQSAGSCITYGRRYIALAIACIAPVDDDGEAASNQPEPESESPTEGLESDVNKEMIAALGAAIASILPAKGKKLEAAVALEELKGPVQKAGDEGLVATYMAKRAEIKALKS